MDNARKENVLTHFVFFFAGEVVYSSNKKTMSNTLNRTGRNRHRGAGGMTSSSSATSCNSCADGGRNGDITYHGDPQQRLCLNNGEYQLSQNYYIIMIGESRMT